MDVLTKLQPVIDRHLVTKFSWGENDCVLFTARCLDAIEGGHYFEDLINTNYTYHGALSAARLIQTEGGLEALATRVLGCEPVPWSQVAPGDPILGRAADRDVLLLGVQYTHHFLTMGPGGMVSLPMDFAIKGWNRASSFCCHR